MPVAYLSLQNPCDASCPMCLSWRNEGRLPLECALDAIRALPLFGFDELVLSGGEFGLYSEIDPVLQACRETPLKLGFITNGRSLAGPPAERLSSDSDRISQAIYSRDFPDPWEHARWRRLPRYSDTTITAAFRGLADAGSRIQINTVLMPQNISALSSFKHLPFWDLVDEWQLIPVKGPIARTWRPEDLHEMKRIGKSADDPLLVRALGMLALSFVEVDIRDIQAGRPTRQLLVGRSCSRQESSIYIDASGHVLPCNSIDWGFRSVVGFGDLRIAPMQEILQTRQQAMLTEHNADRVGCNSCDPLNLRFNMNRGPVRLPAT